MTTNNYKILILTRGKRGEFKFTVPNQQFELSADKLYRVTITKNSAQVVLKSTDDIEEYKKYLIDQLRSV